MALDKSATNVPVIQYNFGHDQRLDRVNKFFLEKTGYQARYIIQAPGRVNIIGDHIDYHGFSVMPMAIEYSIFMACGYNEQHSNNSNFNEDEIIQLFNVESNLFPDWSGKISADSEWNLMNDSGWHSFFLCGYIGSLKKKIASSYNVSVLGNNGDLKQIQPSKMHIAVYSDLPTAAGLSSSSALVCASTLATRLALHDNNNDTDSEQNCNVNEVDGDDDENIHSIRKTEVAKDCAIFERLIGTNGGGMDQAVIMTADEGYAKYVEFIPELTCRNVKLPLGLSFLISHCGAEYFKAATSGYNVRVLETKLAVAVISRHAGIDNNVLKIDDTISFYRLKDCLGMTLKQLSIYVKEQVFKQKDVFTLSEICDMLSFESVDKMITIFKTTRHIVDEIDNSFKLKSRSIHVIEEALRVETFKYTCETTMDMKILGNLMTESHHSLRDLYECSHPYLDRIVQTALEAGALGSRLTGAGWAGCAITLVEDSKCAKVIEELRKVSKFTIKTEPQTGCKIYKLN